MAASRPAGPGSRSGRACACSDRGVGRSSPCSAATRGTHLPTACTKHLEAAATVPEEGGRRAAAPSGPGPRRSRSASRRSRKVRSRYGHPRCRARRRPGAGPASPTTLGYGLAGPAVPPEGPSPEAKAAMAVRHAAGPSAAGRGCCLLLPAPPTSPSPRSTRQRRRTWGSGITASSGRPRPPATRGTPPRRIHVLDDFTRGRANLALIRHRVLLQRLGLRQLWFSLQMLRYRLWLGFSTSLTSGEHPEGELNQCPDEDEVENDGPDEVQDGCRHGERVADHVELGLEREGVRRLLSSGARGAPPGSHRCGGPVAVTSTSSAPSTIAPGMTGTIAAFAFVL